jgi:two-component system response regulator ChvI
VSFKTRIPGLDRTVDVLQGPRRIRVLIVDPDRYFRRVLGQLLGRNGYLTFEAADGSEALEFLTRDPAHLVILEWRLGGATGIEVMRDIRARWPDLPIVFLSTLAEPIYEEEALASGAAEFVDKARGNSILVRRLERIQLQHFPKMPLPVTLAPEVKVGPLKLVRDTRRAWWNGNEVKLTVTEFRVVVVFAERAGLDLSYRVLYDLVHGTGIVSGRGNRGFRDNVRHFVQRVREKFAGVDPDFAEIETHQGYGYRWRAGGAASQGPRVPLPPDGGDAPVPPDGGDGTPD